MKPLAARIAAAMRLGLTSLAAIDPEWSSTSTSDASRIGVRWLTCGRASATATNASAAISAAIGIHRRQPPGTSSASRSVLTAVKRTA